MKSLTARSPDLDARDLRRWDHAFGVASLWALEKEFEQKGTKVGIVGLGIFLCLFFVSKECMLWIEV